jgi:hypothetical protein
MKSILFLTFFILFTTITSNAFTTLKSNPNNTSDTTKQKATITLKKKMLEDFLNRKHTGKEKIAFFLYKHNLIPKKYINQKNKIDENEAKSIIKGRSSLRFSLIGWLLIIIGGLAALPFLGFIALGFFITSIVLGIQSLNLKKKGNTNAVLGIIFSSLYFLLFLVALGLVFAALV